VRGCGRIVDLREGEFRPDFGEGNDGVQSGVDLEEEDAY